MRLRVKVQIFRNSLKRALQYFKQGWHNSDSDMYFVFKDQIWKTKRVCEYSEKNPSFLNDEQYQKELKLMASLMERIIENNYVNILHTELDKKYGKIDLNCSEKGTWILKRTGETPENAKIIRKLEQEARLLAENQRMEEIDKVTQMFKRYLMGLFI